MPPKSPPPPHRGLRAAWVRTPDRRAPAPWTAMWEFLLDKLGPGRDCVDPMLTRGGFVDEHGIPWRGDEPYQPDTLVWFHRELRPEAEMPGTLEVLHRDGRVVVFDKPHFLSTIPRGRYVLQSAVVRDRAATGLLELPAAHRLDRDTSGVPLMTVGKRWRSAYQDVFARHEVNKVYKAVTPFNPDPGLPRMVESHLVKRAGVLQAETLGLPPNSETWIDVIEVRGAWARYKVRPRTGRTHQTRAHFSQLGLSLFGSPFYPVISDVDADNFTTPLQLLAWELFFTDPVDESERRFTLHRRLARPDEVA